MFSHLLFSGNIAVITEQGEKMTYDQLNEEIGLFNATIPSQGLICCLCENSLGALVGYVAGTSGNNPMILLDGGRDFNYVNSYIESYLPEYIWCPSSQVNEFAGGTLYERYGYSLIQMNYGFGTKSSKLHEELCICLTTSGSTGSPKLVRLTKKNLLSNAQSIAEYLNISEKERPITTLPMYYSFGLSVINSHLIKGATILLTNSTLFSKSFWRFFELYNPTSIAGVPFTYEMLGRMGFFDMKLPSLKTMIQAGGKLNAEIVRRYVRFASETGRHFIVMYGQTEASPRMSYLPFEYAERKPSSIGIAIPGGQFLLYDYEGKIIHSSEVQGELVYKGPNVCMGYAERRCDLARGDENKGLLKTGDVAYRDIDGFYYITGRLKRFVKIWGNRYNLDAIEQLIKPITLDCACVGNDKRIVVCVEDPKYINDISCIMQKKLLLDKSCFIVQTVNQIPKTESGKIQYKLLEESISL